jgi:heme/copper-type cytochrome/quinol oxidase subunit 2
MRKIYSTAIIFLLSAAPLLSSGAEGYLTLKPPAPGAGTNMQDFVTLIVKLVQMVAVPFLVMAIIYSGYLFVAAKGNEKELGEAKLWLFSTLIGALIILGAQVIATAIFNTAGIFN